MARVVRNFTFDRAKVDAEKRTAPMVFSTETPVDRGAYDEILDHNKDAVDLSRMQDAPLLLNHDFNQQIGVVETYEISGKEGRAVVRFSNSPLGKEIFDDVKDGIRKQASVGYERTKAISRTKLDGGRDAIRFAWAPFELTITPVGADPNSGLGRSQPIQNDPIPDLMKRNLLFDPQAGGSGGGGTTVNVEEIRNKARTDEMTRQREIKAGADAIAKQFPGEEQKFRDLEAKAVSEGRTVDEFNHDLLKAIPGVRKAQLDAANLGMSQKEQRRFSLIKAIRAMSEPGGKLDGLELEVHQEMKKRCPDVQSSGLMLPADLLVDSGRASGFRTQYQRDLNVTTASQGGNFVQTSVLTPIVEILRNRMVTNRFGVQNLSGLQGNIALPRQTGAATAYTVSEQAVLTKSTQAINQISLSPHRVGAYNAYSKQLLVQSSVDVENFMRDDLMKVLAIKMDLLTLEGAGGSEPIGVKNTSGIGSVTFGAAATWAKAISFETSLATSNADVGRMGYITTPTVRGKWKSAVKVTGVASFLWENNLPVMFSGPAPDYGVGNSNDGVVNGYRAAATNQLSSDLVSFGNWEDCIQAMWGGFDVVVDPYTSASSATVNIAVNTFFDVAVRHAASFVWSTDSGAQ